MTNNNYRSDLTQQLHSLNSDYVEHVADHCLHVSASAPPLPYLDALNRLSPMQRHDLCATPYSLFYLPFANADYWRDAFATMPHTLDVAARSMQLHGHQRLVASALMLAWHAARSEPGAGRLLFGMSSPTLEVFRYASVGQLLGAVGQAATLLRPRWPAHPFFWPELIQAAGCDFVRLHAARLLGAQMLASEATVHDRSAFQAPKANAKNSRRDEMADAPGATL